MNAPPSDDDCVWVVRQYGRLYVNSYGGHHAVRKSPWPWIFPTRMGEIAWNRPLALDVFDSFGPGAVYSQVRRYELDALLDMEHARLAMEGA